GQGPVAPRGLPRPQPTEGGVERAAVAPVTARAAMPVSGGSGGLAQSKVLSASEMARLKGYEGDPCSDCGQFTMVRNGTCLKCITCGTTTGCSGGTTRQELRLSARPELTPASAGRRLALRSVASGGRALRARRDRT